MKSKKILIAGIGSLLVAGLLITRFIEISTPVQPLQANKCKVGEKVEGIPCEVLDQINAQYLLSVKPILDAKCAACHGQTEKKPLYTIVPPLSWLTTHNINEAQEHLDMTYDFPFKGKHSIPDQLEDFQEVITDSEMPPLEYLALHWKSSLSIAESKTILEWIKQSQKSLGDYFINEELGSPQDKESE